MEDRKDDTAEKGLDRLKQSRGKHAGLIHIRTVSNDLPACPESRGREISSPSIQGISFSVSAASLPLKRIKLLASRKNAFHGSLKQVLMVEMKGEVEEFLEACSLVKLNETGTSSGGIASRLSVKE